MFYANEQTKQYHWCKVCHMLKAVTSQIDCRWKFQIRLKFFLSNLQDKLHFEVCLLGGMFVGDINFIWNSELYWNLGHTLAQETDAFDYDASYHLPLSTFVVIVKCTMDMLAFFTNKMVSLPLVCFFLLNHLGMNSLQQDWNFQGCLYHRNYLFHSFR